MLQLCRNVIERWSNHVDKSSSEGGFPTPSKCQEIDTIERLRNIIAILSSLVKMALNSVELH
ncbi:hypothetical protein TorRG33x02_247240 [Trema orientale]|uniref:Uncharacterized protein n=1 Tax=Trema orientale TaxID=63057 RepID=A0A2P5DMD1_TREOI|nr:hypothetical protein TorRG33x02_247240 [Trema orientale]